MTVIAPSSSPVAGGLVGGRGRLPLGPEIAAAPLASVVNAVRSAVAQTRPQLLDATGLSRKIVTQRVDQAIELGLIEEGDLAPSGGGRQARIVRFNPQAGRVVGVQVGASEITVGLADLTGRLLDTSHEDWAIEAGPEPTMDRIREHIDRLLRRHRVDRPWAIAVGLPGPVDFATGALTAPPIMPGWSGFAVRHWLRAYYDAPVWADNDVNLMAVGEWVQGSDVRGRDLLFVKVGTGVGAGYISNGRLIRGQAGAAGDIGHIHVAEASRRCRCGRVGCLEAVAGGWSMLMEISERRAESPFVLERYDRRGRIVLGDVGEAVGAGDPLVTEIVERSSRAIADTVASLVNFINPGLVVVGGGVLRTGTHLVDVLRSVVEERCVDLVTSDLEIRAASLDHQEGVRGAALMAAENLFSPAALAQWVEAGSPLGRAVDLQRSADAFR